MQTETKPIRRDIRARGAAAAVLAAVALLAPSARAQEDSISVPFTTRASHETNALEIAVGLGSAQGYGKTESGGPTLDNLGAGADVSVGWRINPRWMVGVYSSSALYPASGGGTTLGTSAGVQANYHFASRLRPWVGVGAGWHGYWISHDGVRSSYQGVDLVRLQLGLDVPITPSFSLEPLLGVTLATFATQKAPAGAASDAGSSSLSVFVLAGALARFDLFGHAANEPLVLTRYLAPPQP
jgi:hypothetical protein